MPSSLLPVFAALVIVARRAFCFAAVDCPYRSTPRTRLALTGLALARVPREKNNIPPREPRDTHRQKRTTAKNTGALDLISFRSQGEPRTRAASIESYTAAQSKSSPQITTLRWRDGARLQLHSVVSRSSHPGCAVELAGYFCCCVSLPSFSRPSLQPGKRAAPRP